MQSFSHCSPADIRAYNAADMIPLPFRIQNNRRELKLGGPGGARSFEGNSTVHRVSLDLSDDVSEPFIF